MRGSRLSAQLQSATTGRSEQSHDFKCDVKITASTKHVGRGSEHFLVKVNYKKREDETKTTDWMDKGKNRGHDERLCGEWA